MSLQVPNMLSAMVNKFGKIIPPWNMFFQQFVDPPEGPLSQTVGSSPFGYNAKEPGTVFIEGGTISFVTIQRGTTGLNLGVQRIIPVRRSDIISVAFSVAPNKIEFYPDF